MNLTIRKATVEDTLPIVKVRKTAFTQEEVKGFSTPEPSIFYSFEELTKAWDHDNVLKGGWEVVIAEIGQEIVGFIVFKIERHCGYIDNINVAATMQKKGIGRALVSHVEEIVKLAGVRLMKTDTTENNAGEPWKSYQFWIRMDYKDTGKRKVTEYDFKEIPFVKSLK